jgi:riboflavin synthase
VFTGIVEAIGTLRAVTPRGNGRVLDIESPAIAPALRPGASVAVAGVCQTVLDAGPARFRVAAESETLRVTTFGTLQPGDAVNLERAMAADGRFDGHLVLGHVDARARVDAVRTDGTTHVVAVEIEPAAREYVVAKGCITVDGVSLTVGPEVAGGRFELYLIPYTWEHTTLHRLRHGDFVNIETDVVGRYVAHMLRRVGQQAAGPATPGVTWEALQRAFGGGRP